jgi:hypothetical protein
MLLKLAEIFRNMCENGLYSFGATKEYMREYMKKRYREKRDSIIRELGSQCASCGTKDGPWHIDHIDAKKKTFRAADVHSVSEEKLKEEKKNFQLLCKDCHQDKTRKAWDFGSPKPSHGTYWMYRRHGCRCDACTKAYRDANKRWNQR